jgi:hypothetical protein
MKALRTKALRKSRRWRWRWAAPTTTAEIDGDDARSFSPPPVDRTHQSPRGKRRMSVEDEREELMRVRKSPREDVPQLEQYGSGGEGGDEEDREHVPLRMDMTQAQLNEQWLTQQWRLQNPNRELPARW